MKCCLNYNQIDTYLQKADEIKIPYEYRAICPNYFERYPDKDIVLQFFFANEEIDWDEIYDLYELSNGHLLLGLACEEDCLVAQENDFRYYYNSPISSYWEFNNFMDKYPDSEYILLGAPLFFDMEYVGKYAQNIRAYPNIANYTAISAEENYCGTWIRPENLGYYERWVSCIEFFVETLEQEQALFRIYMQEEEFIGPLNLIVKDLGPEPILNNFVFDDFAIRRCFCKQNCQHGGSCRICKGLVHLTDIEKLEEYYEALNELKEEQLEKN